MEVITIKDITFQLKSLDGEVLNENQLTINDDDILIMTFDDTISYHTASQIFENINKGLESGSKMIGYPKGIELKVLSKSDKGNV